jgi:N-carbamoyl-L-amino-acid hydrolase
LERLSAFRVEGWPGWTRRPFTPVYQAAREWLAERMADAGLAPGVDAAGNLIGRRAGRRPGLPPLVTGSHTDTVAGGGRFDGIVGVLGALEVARCLREAGIALDHPLEVVDFLAEEPTDFGVSTVGSRGLVGALDAAALARRDPEGRTLAEAIAAMGGRPGAIAAEARRPGAVALYLELHIEQGPVLEREGIAVGIVSGIVGIRRYRIDIEGRPDHAGTTPMAARRDALAAAAEVVLALEALCQGEQGAGTGGTTGKDRASERSAGRQGEQGAGSAGTVGTVGRLLVSPNAANVVPGFVELWAEVRSVDEALLEERERALLARAAEIAARRGVAGRVDPVAREEPVRLPERVQEVLAAVVCDLRLPVRRLPSFAGHDANHMARIAPTGMLFVPSRGGRSHCPEEWTDLADVARGVQALGEALVRFDRQLGQGPDNLKPEA